MGTAHTYIVVNTDFEPKFWCRVCKHPFAKHELKAYEKHVVNCAEEHDEALMVRSKYRNPLLAAPDPEWEIYNNLLIADGQNPEVQYNRGRRSNIRRARES